MQQQRPQKSRSEKMDMVPAVDRKEGQEEEMIISKHTASIFIGTDFEEGKNADITTIVFTGMYIKRDRIKYRMHLKDTFILF